MILRILLIAAWLLASAATVDAKPKDQRPVGNLKKQQKAYSHAIKRVHGNNGLGNGLDPQPPGNPPVNDGPGAFPGHPGNKMHGRR